MPGPHAEVVGNRMAGLVDLDRLEVGGLPVRHDDVTGVDPVAENRLDGARHRHSGLAGTNHHDPVNLVERKRDVAGNNRPLTHGEVPANRGFGLNRCEGSVNDGAHGLPGVGAYRGIVAHQWRRPASSAGCCKPASHREAGGR